LRSSERLITESNIDTFNTIPLLPVNEDNNMHQNCLLCREQESLELRSVCADCAELMNLPSREECDGGKPWMVM